MPNLPFERSVVSRPAASRIGRRVDAAVATTHSGTLPAPFCFTSGKLSEIVLNPPSTRDIAIEHVISDLKRAKHEFCLQSYIFDVRSVAGNRLLHALAEKQRELPEFKIFLAVNHAPFTSGARLLRALDKHGVRAAVSFHPVAFGRASLHSKAYIIDGSIAYIGGDNVDNPREADILARFEGAVVQSLLTEFDDAFTSGRVTRRYSTSAVVDLCESHSRLPAHAARANEVPLTILTKRGADWWSRQHGHDSSAAILAALRGARKDIKLCSPNFNDVQVWRAITDAAERGVSVQLLIPHGYNSFAAFIDRATNAAIVRYRELLPADVAQKIEIRWYSTNGKRYQWNHAKFVAVDDEWAYVGSQNMDNQGFWFSRELGVGVDSAPVVQRLSNQIFDRPWETSIPAKIGWLARILPLPSMNWVHRLARICMPPLILLERLKDAAIGVLGPWSTRRLGASTSKSQPPREGA